MITCATVTKREIRSHYDLANLFYWLLWGPHIHHGLWEGDESPARAQIQLTERLARDAAVARGDAVLDVGSGMGGSAVHLARRLGCRVTGLTVSPVQRAWAGASARLQGMARRVHFVCADAEAVEFAEQSFDVVWSIECTEHLFEKPRFFRRAARWLRPRGRMAVCAWLAADEPYCGTARQQLEDVCEGFLCPSLGTMQEYRQWMAEAGLQVAPCADLTRRVARTWEICLQRVRRAKLRGLAACVAGPAMVKFIDRFETILGAYRSGALRYGCFVATKPDA